MQSFRDVSQSFRDKLSLLETLKTRHKSVRNEKSIKISLEESLLGCVKLFDKILDGREIQHFQKVFLKIKNN